MTSYFKHKMRGKSPGTIAGLVFLGIIGITGLAILFGFIIMWLWNWLMPELFGLTTVSYWQAVGLFILLKILIGGCGGGSKKHHHHSSDHACESNNKKKSKHDFSKWKHYDNFWNEEGEKAYEQYVNKLNNENEDGNESE